MSKYPEELKQKVLHLFYEEGRSKSSLDKEFGLGKGTTGYWIKTDSKECQNNEEKAAKIKENQRMRQLQKEIEELRKENEFLKKAAAFFAKELD